MDRIACYKSMQTLKMVIKFTKPEGTGRNGVTRVEISFSKPPKNIIERFYSNAKMEKNKIK